MALPAFAEPSALADWLGDPDVDIARAAVLVQAASTLVRTETGSAWVDAVGALQWEAEDASEKLQVVGQAITAAVVASAARAYANPSGFIQEAVGPFSGTRHRDAGDGVFLTATERRSITDAVAALQGRTAPGLWTLGTTRNDPLGDTVYVPTGPAPSGYPFPFLTSEDV